MSDTESLTPSEPALPAFSASSPDAPTAPRAGWLSAHPREAAWILAGVALLVRLVYVFHLKSAGKPYFYPDRLDPFFYFNWGRSIAAGNWIGDAIFVQSPLYAYLVAFFLKIFGERWVFPTLQIFQVLIGVWTCLLTVRIGRRVLGDGVAPWLGGILAALYGPFLFYEGMVMKTFLSTFLTVLLVDLLLRSGGSRRGLLLVSGFVFALTSLVRDNFVLLYPLLLIGLFLGFREIATRERVRACLLFTAGAALGILPVTIRNYAVGHEFALLTTGGGEVFYIGNNADANGRYLPPPFVHADPGREHQDFITKAGELSGRKLLPGESSNFWLRQGLSWIAAHPADWARLLLRKLEIFWNAYELPDNYNYYEVRQVLLRPLSLPGLILLAPLSLFTFGLVAPLGLVGIALTLRRWRSLLLVYLVLFGYMGTVLLFFNFSRFRVPVVPFLCLFAGATLAALAKEARDWFAWFWAPRPAEAAEAAETADGASASPVAGMDAEMPAPGSAPGAAGMAAEPMSDGGAAEAAETRGAPAEGLPSPWSGYLRRPWVAIYPILFLVFFWTVNYLGIGGQGVFPALQMERNLGDTYRLQGRFEEAEREYRRGLQILGDEPMDPATAASLGVDPARIRQEVENERMAQGVNFGSVKAGLHFGLGALWLDQGKDLLGKDRAKGEDLIRRGVREVETAARTVPYPGFLRRLAEGYTLLGLTAEAEKSYRAGVGLFPEDFGLHYDLAGLYYEGGRYAEALKEMQAAKNAKADLSGFELSDYHYGVGLVYLDGFRARGKALYHFQKALEANPQHREAKRIGELIDQISREGVKPEPGD